MSRKAIFMSALALALASLLGAGCRPEYPKCENDEHCRGNTEKNEGRFLYCVNGQCQECRNDGDCPKGKECVGNRCEIKPECRTDPECGRCQTAVYCSTQCQMTDWRAHAAACVEGIGERAAVAAAQIPDELEHALEEHPHAPVGWSCPRIGSVGGLPRLTWAEYLVEVHNHAVFEDEGRRSRVREGLEAACANPFLADAHAEMWKHLPGATWVAAQHTYSEALDDETRATYAKYSCDHTHISRELKTAVGRTAAHGPASAPPRPGLVTSNPTVWLSDCFPAHLPKQGTLPQPGRHQHICRSRYSFPLSPQVLNLSCEQDEENRTALPRASPRSSSRSSCR